MRFKISTNIQTSKNTDIHMNNNNNIKKGEKKNEAEG